MKQTKTILLFIVILLIICIIGCQSKPQYSGKPPVISNASPEARRLLSFLYEISGKGMLAGLHNLLWVWSPDKDTNLVYRKDWYDQILVIADGMPIAITEGMVLPSEDVLNEQPAYK